MGYHHRQRFFFFFACLIDCSNIIFGIENKDGAIDTSPKEENRLIY
jgi:hypothetical protein